jgi:hypothetical protein
MLDVSNETSPLRSYAMSAADSIYGFCFCSVASFSLALLLAGAVSIAVACNVVHVPEFHPR